MLFQSLPPWRRRRSRRCARPFEKLPSVPARVRHAGLPDQETERLMHYCSFLGLQWMSDITQQFCRVASDDAVRRDIFCDDTAGSNNSVFTNSNVGKNG